MTTSQRHHLIKAHMTHCLSVSALRLGSDTCFNPDGENKARHRLIERERATPAWHCLLHWHLWSVTLLPALTHTHTHTHTQIHSLVESLHPHWPCRSCSPPSQLWTSHQASSPAGTRTWLTAGRRALGRPHLPWAPAAGPCSPARWPPSPHWGWGEPCAPVSCPRRRVAWAWRLHQPPAWYFPGTEIITQEWESGPKKKKYSVEGETNLQCLLLMSGTREEGKEN